VAGAAAGADGYRPVRISASGGRPKCWRKARVNAPWSASPAARATALGERQVRKVDELSGGQRQRVWIAMVLAQQTPVILLDEPTTFLDMAHQIDVLELPAHLHRSGRTLVTVLHDLNHAARYATHLVVMSDGRVVAQGPPREVLTEQLVADVFGIEAVIIADPTAGTPLVVPRGRPYQP